MAIEKARALEKHEAANIESPDNCERVAQSSKAALLANESRTKAAWDDANARISSQREEGECVERTPSGSYRTMDGQDYLEQVLCLRGLVARIYTCCGMHGYAPYGSCPT